MMCYGNSYPDPFLGSLKQLQLHSHLVSLSGIMGDGTLVIIAHDSMLLYS